MKITIRMTAVLCAIGCRAQHYRPHSPPRKAHAWVPLASLPTMPGPHIDKIKALADNAWLVVSVHRPRIPSGARHEVDRGVPSSPDCADLNAAFLCGEGIHGWYNKQTNRYMDDLWAYDVNGHRWICLHPGTDIKNIYLKMSADGFEVDETGQPIPVAQMGHGFAMVTYDTDRNKFMFMPCPVGNYLPLFGERRKAWGGYKWPLCPVDCSPWMYNASTGQFEIAKIKGVWPGAGNGSRIGVAVYVPGIQQMFLWVGGTDAWLYDPKKNVWTNIKPTGPKPPFGIDANACLDTKRGRIYLGGGYYPVVGPGKNAFWCYDVKTNAWVDLQPKGKACAGCNRYGPNQAPHALRFGQ